MSYYCPIALMDDIRGDGSSSISVLSNHSSDNNSGTMIRVQFPPLPSHAAPAPPTDSETSATASTTASAEEGGGDDHSQQPPSPRRCSNSDEGERSECDNASATAGNNDVGHPSTTATGAMSSVNEPSANGERRPERPSVSEGAVGDNDDDSDEMEIEDLDFALQADPAGMIKSALNKLVACAKRRKKRMEELAKSQRIKQQQQQGEVAPGTGKSAEGCSLPQVAQRVASRKPSLKQRPVQVIMTWMDKFQDHEKIQLICLQALPSILDDPSNRFAAQADGLASIVLYNMAAFPTNSLLQLTAFHTLVVLLRPLGANEGMVNKATVSTKKSSKGIRSINAHKKRHGSNSSKSRSPSAGHHTSLSKQPILNNGNLLDASCEPRWEENGVRVMLASMRRFSSDRYLQAMGCWAMVNAALYPSLKKSLLKLGGVYTVTNAMMLHPNVEAVQFRGLFALINLVIPDNSKKLDGDGSSIHSHIYQISRLTILAMKNFHMNKSILNRGCLVLRNLSLTPAFVKILSRTPGCVDMLLHCRQMCPRDVLVQRSARTTMILMQRVTEKDSSAGNCDKSMFKLTQPRPLGSSMAAGTSPMMGNSASSSYAMSASTPASNLPASNSSVASFPPQQTRP